MGDEKKDRSGFGLTYYDEEGRSYDLRDPDRATEQYIEDRLPWILSSLGSAYENGMGTLMHIAPQSRGGMIDNLAGLAQEAEQAVGQVMLGDVAGRATPIFQHFHKVASDRLAGGRLKEQIVETMRRSSGVRTIASTLFQGHWNGLSRFQEEALARGEPHALIDRVLPALEADAGLSEEVYAAVLNTVYATAPTDYRTRLRDHIADHPFGRTVLNYGGPLAVPDGFATDLLPNAQITMQPPPDISSRLSVILQPLYLLTERTTYNRLADFVSGGEFDPTGKALGRGQLAPAPVRI